MIKLFKQLGGKSARLFVAAAVFAVAVAASVPAPASADPWQGHDNFGQVISINTPPSERMCLQSVSPDANSLQELCSGYYNNTFWHMQRQGNGNYKIMSYTSGGTLCLTVAGSDFGLPQKVTNGSCAYGPGSREWIIDWTSYGFKLHPAGGIWDYGINGRGKCLDVFSFSHDARGLVALWDCNGAVNQLWRFTGLWQ